jgi:hypothetical protein
MPRRIRDWNRLVAELESSGLSRAEFCRRRNVNYQTMTGWVKRLAADRAGGKDREPSLPVPRVTSFVEVPIGNGGSSASYEVVLGCGRAIRVESNFDDEVLARLIKVVASC